MNANSKITAIDSEIGALIRKRRVAKGWTLVALAVALGCTHQQLTKYERGRDRVSAAQVWRIADVLGVLVASLYPEKRAR
jgi:transcriptional regulator with XRE-family HTH domain